MVPVPDRGPWSTQQAVRGAVFKLGNGRGRNVAAELVTERIPLRASGRLWPHAPSELIEFTMS